MEELWDGHTFRVCGGYSALLEPGVFFRAVVVEEASHRLCWRRWTPGGVTRVDVVLLKNWHEELFGLLVYFVSSVRLRQKWSCIQS